MIITLYYKDRRERLLKRERNTTS